jgi:glucosyl-3-phosphoglycerate synthase
MGDFAQSGLICTLQQLNATHLEQIEAELPALTVASPVALILPCHEADLHGPAIHRLRDELRGAKWLSEIVVSLNGVDAMGAPAVRAFFGALPQPVRLIWNDAVPLAAVHAGLMGAPQFGKGLNVWAAIGLLSATSKPAIIATQDCDVASFRRSSLARLCYAGVHPELNFAFAKMYYPRVTDRLYGRVSRLFLAPLLQALIRVTGHQPLLDFLASFRYPLAGEMALRRDLAESLPWESGWGLEIAGLCETFRRVDPREVCQVDGGSDYDHKHQPAQAALTAMCSAIAEALFAQLTAEGAVCDAEFRQAIERAFRRESADARRRYAALARINALPFDTRVEEETAEAFAGVITSAVAQPGRALPAWETLRRERPEWVEEFLAAADGQLS